MKKKAIEFTSTQQINFAGEVAPYGVKAHRTASIEGRAFGSILGALPNPDQILQKAGKGLEVYRELLYDAQVSSCIDSRKAGVLALEWEFNRGQVQNEITAFVKEQFKKLNMYNIIGQILDAPGFGFQVMESYFAPVGDKALLLDIVGKPQEWFTFGIDNSLLFRTINNRNGEYTDPRKFTVAQHKATDTNPYGSAILAKCFWPVTFKKNGLKFWIRFAEKYGMPYLYGKLPPSAMNDQSKSDELLDQLDAIVQDSVGVLPPGTEVTLLEAGRTSTVDLYERLVKYFDSQISKAILSHSSGVDSTPGQLGNENQSILVRDDIIQADKRIVEGVINEIVQNLVKLNFGANAPAPVFEMFERDDVDMEIAQRDAVLAASLKVAFTKTYIEKQYNLNSEDFDLIADAPAPGAFEEPNDFADAPDGTRTEQTIIDGGVNTIAGGAEPAIDELIRPIAELINNGSDYSEVQSKIVELFGEMDSTRLEQIMENSIFAADVIGRLATKTRVKNER